MNEPRSSAVEAWLVDLRAGPDDPGEWGSRWSLLDRGERTRADALRRPEDRYDFVAAHGALRAILGRSIGVGPATIGFRRLDCPLCGGPHGRPALADPGPAFSLSRARGWAAVVVGTEAAIGVDLEHPGATTFVDLRSALHPDEVTALIPLDEPDRSAAAQRCWVRKEALLKGRGTGLGIDPDTVFVGPGVGPVDPPQPVTGAGPPGWWLVDVPAPTIDDDESGESGETGGSGGGLVVAVAHRLGPEAEVAVRTVTIDELLPDG